MGKKVAFAKSLALVGVLAGIFIAVIVPIAGFIAAGAGVIPGGGAIAIAIVCVLAGTPIVIVSTFFGIVIPSTVEKSDGDEHRHFKDKWHKHEKDDARQEDAEPQGRTTEE